MNDRLFNSIDIKLWNTHVLNGKAANPELECKAFEKKILASGGKLSSRTLRIFSLFCMNIVTDFLQELTCGYWESEPTATLLSTNQEAPPIAEPD